VLDEAYAAHPNASFGDHCGRQPCPGKSGSTHQPAGTSHIC
jgi:hypothetical protein